MRITGFHWFFLIFTSREFKETCFKLERDKDLDPNVLTFLTNRFLWFFVIAVSLLGYCNYISLQFYFESGFKFILFAIALFWWVFWSTVRGHLKILENNCLAYSFPVLIDGKVKARWLCRYKGMTVDYTYSVDNESFTGEITVGNWFGRWKKESKFPLIYSSHRPSAACPYDSRMVDFLCLSRKKKRLRVEGEKLNCSPGLLGGFRWTKM